MRDLTVHEILGLQLVQRWHTRPTLRPQTVADHSATVALLALYIGGPELTTAERLRVVLLGLQHDAHEAQFGDIPYPSRMALLVLGIDIDAICSKAFWGANGPESLTFRLEQDLVAVADRLEAFLYAKRFVPLIPSAGFLQEARAMVLELLGEEDRLDMQQRALAILEEVL